MSELSRREFLRTGTVAATLVGAAAVTGAALTSSALADSDSKQVIGTFKTNSNPPAPYSPEGFHDDPTGPLSYGASGLIVFLECPCSDEELDRTECHIERSTDADFSVAGNIVPISDPNGFGTTLEPLDGSIVSDVVPANGTYYYRASATYDNNSTVVTPVALVASVIV